LNYEWCGEKPRKISVEKIFDHTASEKMFYHTVGENYPPHDPGRKCFTTRSEKMFYHTAANRRNDEKTSRSRDIKMITFLIFIIIFIIVLIYD